MDRLTPAERSALMAKIRSRNTKPELLVRRLAHSLGFRFRLHAKHLPGSPDLVFPRLRKAIFVHGCFWHAHACRNGRRIPATNREYWLTKRRRNRSRDRKAAEELEAGGWKVLQLWECELAEESHLQKALQSFLGPLSRKKPTGLLPAKKRLSTHARPAGPPKRGRE